MLHFNFKKTKNPSFLKGLYILKSDAENNSA